MTLPPHQRGKVFPYPLSNTGRNEKRHSIVGKRVSMSWFPRKFPVPAVGVGVLLGLTLALPAEAGVAGAGSTVSVPKIAFQQYVLTNGLTVILAPDAHAAAPPVIAVNVTYAVGSRSERPGRSGFAHLFEHMMFQGSENVAKTEHILLVQSNGGSMNGTTNQDRTNFFEALPANQLHLALFLEADRMRSLDISKANLENQRQVVEEEKRQSYDNRAYGHAYENLLDLAYTGFPYKHTTIGSMADLDAASLDDVRQFHQTYYEPNNAVLSVTGRFDPADARRAIEKYFGPIARGAEPPPVTFAEPSAYPGERRRTLRDPLARQPRYLAGYVTVPATDPDYFALVLLGDILGDGTTSRLYQALVEKRLATSAGGGEDENLGPGLFTLSMNLPTAGDPARAETALNAEIERIGKEGVTDDEMRTALAGERISEIRGLQTALGRAARLSLYGALFKDPGRVNTILPRLQAVTPADIQRVAAKYLVPANRSVVLTLPVESAASEGDTK